MPVPEEVYRAWNNWAFYGSVFSKIILIIQTFFPKTQIFETWYQRISESMVPHDRWYNCSSLRQYIMQCYSDIHIQYALRKRKCLWRAIITMSCKLLVRSLPYMHLKLFNQFIVDVYFSSECFLKKVEWPSQPEPKRNKRNLMARGIKVIRV